MFPPVGFTEILLILAIILVTFGLAFLFRVLRSWWRRR